MRITLEPTDELNLIPHTKVILEVPEDDVPVEMALELCSKSLVAWGYDANLLTRKLESMKDSNGP